MRWMIPGSALAVVAVIGGVAAYVPGSGAGTPAPARSADTHNVRHSEDRADDAGRDDPGRRRPAHAREMVAIARAHRTGMHKWHSCVQAAAKAGSADPTKGCDKPLPPGWVKHPDQHHGGPGKDAADHEAENDRSAD